MSYQNCAFMVCNALFHYCRTHSQVFKQEEMILFTLQDLHFLYSKVTTHDALIQFWLPSHLLSRLLNLFFMLMQCGINV